MAHSLMSMMVMGSRLRAVRVVVQVVAPCGHAEGRSGVDSGASGDAGEYGYRARASA
ncbi:hypothetical protein [Streptomyces sp. NPDC059753]|uniref:hypothetical protein n=1 Tax=Streptomyces sp. NPDC059753 TaxID=3346933 RepID=UPI00364FEA0F